MEIIMELLNDEQREAVESQAKYLQISAGPGTGKTSTLAARILHLQLEREVDSNRILAITFSRTAKQNLVNKMNSFISKIGYGSTIKIYTFHSLAHRIIRYGIFSGESKYRSGFRTMNTIDILQLKPDTLHGLCKEYQNRTVVAEALSKCLNLVRQGKYLKEQVCSHWREIHPLDKFKIEMDEGMRILIKGSDLVEFWSRMDNLKKIKNVTDYQGLINESIRLLLLRGPTYQAVREEWNHLLVDEYQDTSLSQEQLLFSIAGDEKEITVVGDKHQTIYTFNGSNIENMDRFNQHCRDLSPAESEHIHLKYNYRSSESIIQLSNQFIREDRITYGGGRADIIEPTLVNTASISLASSYIGRKIQQLVQDQGMNYRDICILFRKNSEYSPQAYEIMEELNRLHIPYTEDFLMEEEENVREEILKILDENVGLPLSTIMEHLKNEGKTKEAEFISHAIEQGAQDADDLIDFLVETGVENEKSNYDNVTLKSVHAAKGMEFPIVFILYLGDRQFPHGSTPNIEEEKRLLYVGITRAMRGLFILGQHGIHSEDFLGQCKESNAIYETFLSAEEESTLTMGQTEKESIEKIEKEQEKEEELRQKRMDELMIDW